MTQIDNLLTFTVRRRAPELIIPAKPTPREVKPLSDIDNQEILRMLVPTIFFYHANPEMRNKNPVSVIKDALAKVLVFYYPFAGRLKEYPSRKLMVDCTGEGVLFVEAEADVTLKQLGDVIHPPFPYFEELLHVPSSGGILDSPLLLIQVTRLLCGGFIIAIGLNNSISDTMGFIQFMTALGEIVKGASAPSILPVWQREILSARDPPRVTCTHYEYDELAATDDNRDKLNIADEIPQRLFFFGPLEMLAIRRLVPPHLQNCSTFDVLTACLWRCRTIAIRPDPKDEMRIVCLVNACKFNSFIPVGYYGNGFAFPVAISTARDLSNKPLGHALELIMKAKSIVTEEYMRSIADLMVIKGRPPLTLVGSYMISDVTRSGFDGVDLGWGKPAYGGPAIGGTRFSNFYIPSKNHKGESGIMVPMYLPSVAMERFVKELDSMLVQDKNDKVLQEHKLLALSRL